MSRIRFVLLVASLLLAARVARAEVEVEVEFGHDGKAVTGAITPVLVRVKSRESTPLRLSITTRLASTMVTGEIGEAGGFLSPGSEKAFTFFTRPWAGSTLSVRFEFDRKVTVRQENKRTPSPERTYLYTMTRPAYPDESESPSALQILAVGKHAAMLPKVTRDVRVIPLEEKRLHEIWHSYDGLDVVYWRNPGEATPLETGRVKSLLRWVELGGRLVVTAPSRPDLLRGSLLGDALPAAPALARPGGRDYGELATLIKGSPWLRDDGEPPSRGAFTPLLKLRGQVTAGSEAEPLAIEAAYGMGSVAVLAFDPARFSKAKGDLAAAIILLMASGRREMPDPGDELDLFAPDPDGFLYFNPDLSPMGGLLDLLRRGSVKPPPMGLLSLFMLLYVLAVGPLDYFILKKKNLLKYSALTFLGLAVIFSVTAYFVSFYLFSGKSRANRITLVDVVPGPDEDSPDRVAVRDFAGIYAPRGGDVELDLQADTVFYSDFVLPEEYVDRSTALARDPVHLFYDSPARPTARVSIPFRSLRAVQTVAFRECEFPLDVEVDPKEGVRVRNGLPHEIRDVTLVGEDFVLMTGENLDPGEEGSWPLNVRALTGSAFRHGFEGSEGLPGRGELASLMGESGVLPLAKASRLARALMALSVGSAISRSGDDRQATLRIYRKAGLDRGEVLRRGGILLFAWTVDRDPLRLPAAGRAGVTMTLIRKVIVP